MVPMFTTSCVQSDLYDLYEEDGWFFPRNKKNKGDYDSHNPTPEQIESFLNGPFNPYEDECVACALYNFADCTYDYYSSREEVGSTLLAWCGNDWKVQYMISVKYYGGIQATDDEMESFFYSALGLSKHTLSESGIIPESTSNPTVYYSGDKIIDINWKNSSHYGVLVKMEHYSSWNVVVKDQFGDNHMFPVSSINCVFEYSYLKDFLLQYDII